MPSIVRCGAGGGVASLHTRSTRLHTGNTAAGYGWLLGLWLAITPFLPPGGQGSGVYREVAGLANWAGKPAVFAAATLAAYVLGTLSIALTHNSDTWLSPLLRRTSKLSWLDPGHRGSNRTLDHVREVQGRAMREGRELPRVIDRTRIDHLRRQAMDDYLYRWHLLDAVAVLDAYVDSAKEDLDYLAPRLLGKEDELYGEYDRLKAEGGFRVGLGLPMGFVLAVLALRLSPWWLLGLVVLPQLLLLGSASWSAAERNLAVALAAERVESPALERLLSAEIEFVSYHELVPARELVPVGLILPRRHRPRKPVGPVRVELARLEKPK